jgi:nucleoside-diphosphate-sugar epimerase
MVGSHIVRKLVETGEKPWALSRNAHQSPDVEWLRGDLRRIAAIPSSDRLFSTVDVQLLADELPRLAPSKLKRVIAFSSTSILTKATSEIAEERESVRRLENGEQALIAACHRLGIDWTILRPTLIYDEGRDQNVTRLAELIRRFGIFPLFGAGAGLRQPVHAEDLAIGALSAADSPAAINKNYVLAGLEVMTYREMVGRIFDGLQLPRRTISVSPWIWRTAFIIVKPFFANSNVAMGVRMSLDMDFDTSAAQEDFDWTPRTFRPQFVTNGHSLGHEV